MSWIPANNQGYPLPSYPVQDNRDGAQPQYQQASSNLYPGAVMESGSLADALDRVDMMSGRLIYPGKDHPSPRESGGGFGWWMRTIFFAALCGFVGAGIVVSSDTFSQIQVPNTVLDTSSGSNNDLLVLAEPEHNRGVQGDFDKLADDADKKAEFSEGKGSSKGGKGTESEFGERMDVLPDPPPAPRVDVANAAADEAKRIKHTETHTNQGLFHTSEGMVLQHQQASSSMDVMPQARDETWWKKAAATLGEELRSKANVVETLFIGDSLFEAWCDLDLRLGLSLSLSLNTTQSLSASLSLSRLRHLS
ncbi:hypothetical protein CYMTET_37087, partial [Cymbomonas tetramitiformis]